MRNAIKVQKTPDYKMCENKEFIAAIKTATA